MQPLFYVDSSTFLNKLFVPCRLHVVSRNLTEAIPGHGSVKNADVIDICFFNVVTTPTSITAPDHHNRQRTWLQFFW